MLFIKKRSSAIGCSNNGRRTFFSAGTRICRKSGRQKGLQPLKRPLQEQFAIQVIRHHWPALQLVLKVEIKASPQILKAPSRITVPDNNTVLEISFVGYNPIEVIVGDRTTLDLTLTSNASDLAQVVVVGYGTQNKKDITGAVKSVKAEAFQPRYYQLTTRTSTGKSSRRKYYFGKW